MGTAKVKISEESLKTFLDLPDGWDIVGVDYIDRGVGVPDANGTVHFVRDIVLTFKGDSIQGDNMELNPSFTHRIIEDKQG